MMFSGLVENSHDNKVQTLKILTIPLMV
jgi:hypothetical protein